MKKNNKLLVSISVLLIIWSIVGVAIAGVVHNNDDQTTSTDSDIIIDHDDSFCKFHNGSFDSIEIGNHTFDPSWMENWNTSSNSTHLNNITNSKGKTWSVTEANFEIAMNDTGTNGWVCVGSDIVFNDDIWCDGFDGTSVSFLNHVVTPPSGDVPLINITNGNHFSFGDIRIDVSTQTGSIIKVYAETDAHRVDGLKLHDIHINNIGGQVEDYNGSGGWVFKEHNFTGIELYANAVGGTGRVFNGLLDNIWIEGSDVGILIKTSDVGYINGFNCYNVYFDRWYEACIEYVEDYSSNGANQNCFYNMRGQTSYYSHYVFKNISGTRNYFDCSAGWDWTVSDSGRYVYWIGSNGLLTEINDMAKGSVYYILDEGYGSKITCANRDLYYDSDYDYKVYKFGEYYHCIQGDYGDEDTGASYAKTTDFQLLMYNILNHDNIVVEIDEGIYECDQYISVRGKNITIRGQGEHGTIIKGVNGTDYASGLFQVNGVDYCNITFENLVISGQGMSDTSRGIYFCVSESMHGLNVYRCKFPNWDAGANSAGIYIRPNSNDRVFFVNINLCDFFNDDVGVYFDGDEDSDIFYSDVSNNCFSRCGYSIIADYVNYSTFSNNKIKDGGAEGISLQGNSSNNIIDRNTIAASTGIELDVNCCSNLVMMNQLPLCSTKITNSGIDNDLAYNKDGT